MNLYGILFTKEYLEFMKVLSIIASKSITFNRFLLEASDSLSKEFNVVLCCRDSFNINRLDNLKKEEIDFPNNLSSFFNLKKTFHFIFQIYKLQKKSDLIYIHTPLASHLVRLVKLFTFSGVKIVYHIHGLRYIPGKWGISEIIFRIIEYILSFKTDKFIVINEADYFSLIKFVPKRKIFLIKGVGVNLSSKYKIKEISKSNKVFVVGVIAAFKKEKGYEELIKIAKICQKNPNITFRVFGYGNSRWILRLIKKEKLKNIDIMGFVKNIEDEIDKFNLFMLPSHREGLNVSIQECLSRGIPVLTTKARGCKDLIIEGYNGYLYDINDIQRASKRILEFTEMSNNKYKKICVNSFNYANNFLSREKKTKEILNVFKEYYA